MKQPAVYIMASRRNGTLYTGVTSNLTQRVWHHRTGIVAGFTKRYGCKMLVWYEIHSTMIDAITREKQIKGGSRQRKIALIEASNSTWRPLDITAYTGWNIGTGGPPSVSLNTSRTFWPTASASKSQSTMLVRMVGPSASVT